MRKARIVLIMILLSCILCACRNQDISLQSENNEDIFAVQLNVAKFEAQKFGKQKLFQLISEIKQMVPLTDMKQENIARGEIYDTVSLIYEDGKKDIFFFYQAGDQWYAETAEGSVYKGADFISDYIEYPETDNKESVRMGFLNENILEIELRVDSSEQQIYQYAVLQDLEMSEEELEQFLDTKMKEAEGADNYEEIVLICEKAGTTLNQYLEENKEYYRIIGTVDKLYKIKYTEFKNGNDTIGNKVCWDIKEYWNTFLQEEVLRVDSPLSVFSEQYTYFKEKKTNGTLGRFAKRKATDRATNQVAPIGCFCISFTTMTWF